MTTAELTRHLKAEALRLGFDRVGIAPAVSPPGHAHLVNWLKAGHGAGMTYMQRHVELRRHPDTLLEGVRSVVMVSLVYGEHVPESSSPVHGKIARYARGLDYHRILWDKLEELLAWLRQQCPGIHGRTLADTAPLMERDFARLAGMGWIGKNTMLINRALGSFTVLGALLVDRDLVADDPHVADHCGTCTRCLDACPTDAFVSAHQLDARRCISYWTIEHKGPIAEEFAGDLHGWVYGCDVCQDVCPWNRKAPAGRLVELHGRLEWSDPDLIEWLDRDENAWRTALRGTALVRTKRVGLVRNAALVLGQRHVAAAVPALARRLADAGEDPVVQAAAAWALGRIGTETAIDALRQTCKSTDATVRDAVAAALAGTTLESETGQPG
jgi:epoxyqueuosine reductase